MTAALNAMREDQDPATCAILERAVALEWVTQSRRSMMRKSEQSHGSARPLEAAKAKGKPEKVAQFEVQEVKAPQPSVENKPDMFPINTPDTGIPGGGGHACADQDLGWWNEPPGLEWKPVSHLSGLTCSGIQIWITLRKEVAETIPEDPEPCRSAME